MAKFVIKGGSAFFNGKDLSDHIKSFETKRSKAKIDATGMTGGGAMDWKPGLSDEEFIFTIMSDFDPGMVDDTLSPLYESEAEFEVIVRPFPGPASPSNPEFSC